MSIFYFLKYFPTKTSCFLGSLHNAVVSFSEKSGSLHNFFKYFPPKTTWGFFLLLL
jgi:hypothetical protein